MSGFVKLTTKQIEKKLDFIKDFTHAENPATGAKLDSNANVTMKNMTSMACELNKDINIQVNRKILYNKISKLFDVDTADEYIRQLEEHEIYAHDETSLMPYTYGAKNEIVVRVGSVIRKLSFEQLYNDVCFDDDEICLDSDKGVWGKYPSNLEIEDREGFTAVSRLIKKVRHRNMVKVETESGKSILVTDNHPMIVTDSKNDTVEAIDCLGEEQFDVYESKWSEVIKADVVTKEADDENEYIYDITTESNTFICNGLWVHNCTAISMYPFLVSGMKSLGGESQAPKHLHSFCGSFVNLIYSIACQFAGAVATAEFLTYFDFFARKDYGDNYLKTNKKEISDLLQQVVYCLNQPAGARNYQSTFWNISLFDKNYFDSLFGNFYFPDFTQPSWKSVQKLQNFFMQWFNEERTKALLTFPVVTAAMVVDKEKPLDEQFARDRAKDLSEGNSFFIYESDSVDSLSSCCRLRNELADNDFSYSLGAGGVKSGSINVITINFNRLIQNVAKSFMTEKEMDKDTMLKEHKEELIERIKEEVKIQVEKIQKYQVSYRSVMESYKAHKMLPVYDAGFIDLDKQFLTTGINGLVEGCEYLGYEISDNQPYKDFVSGVLKVIYDADKAAKAKYGYKMNCEFVPGENLGIKNSKWDREAGLEVPRDCYNSYFYKVEDTTLNIIDKFRLHGGSMISYLDGGSALHLNLREYPDAEQYYKMMCIAATEGCNYWTTNIMTTVCESCGHIDKHTLEECPACGSKSISYATRIIGYLKKISNFGKDRQIEAAKRYYH